MQLDLQRRANDYVVRRLDFRATDAIRAHVEGGIADATGSNPRFDDFLVRFGPIDLAGALALLPEGKRPPGEVGGRATMTWTVDGRVPYRLLMTRVKPPQVETVEGTPDMRALMQGYLDYVQRWADYFADDLSFSTRFAVVLNDVAFADEKNDLSGVELKFATEVSGKGPGMTFAVDVAEMSRPLQARALHGDFGLTFTDDGFDVRMGGRVGRVERDNLPRPLDGAALEMAMGYRIGGDLALDSFLVTAPDRGVRLEASGIISKPARFGLGRGWELPGLPGLDAALRWSARMDSGEPEALTVGGPVLGGEIGVSGSLRAADGVIRLEGLFGGDRFSYEHGKIAVEEMSGSLPFDIALTFDPRDDATVLRRKVPIGSGVVALLTSDADIRTRAARPVYYDRLRPYREHAGLTIRRLRQGLYEINDFELEGRLTEGMLLADRIAMNVLGGDITGNIGFQLGRDASIRSELAFRVSNIDASYFEALSLEPGPRSELSADLQFGFLFAPRQRDLTLNMNITKIGAETLDRFLQVLDPDGTDATIQKNRRNLGWVDINAVAAWIRYENFNMDMDASTFMHIPFTDIGFPNIDRELLRRYSITDQLNEYAQPYIDKFLAPNLGWDHAG